MLMVLNWTMTMGVERKEHTGDNTGGRMQDLTVMFSAIKLG